MDSSLLKPYAAKYIWWKTPEESVKWPERVIAQVMNIGEFDDAQALAEALGEDVLRQVLQHAEVGMFSPRSWHYWQYRLGMAKSGEVPPLPTRRLPQEE